MGGVSSKRGVKIVTPVKIGWKVNGRAQLQQIETKRVQIAQLKQKGPSLHNG